MGKKINQIEIKWKIPSAINLPNILKRNPPKFSYKPDYFYYFIHVICDKMDYLDPCAKDKWVYLHSNRMKDITEHYKAYLDYLISNRIIILNPSYSVGKRCKGYRIASNYYKGDVTDIALVDDTNLSFKRKLRAKIFCNKKKLSKKDQHLSKWFNEKLKIDINGAQQEINQLYALNSAGRFKALRAVKNISEGRFYYKIDENIGRFHSNLTNMKKDLRNYLTYDGFKLVNLDIKNSQPLLSGILLDKIFYEPGGDLALSSLKSVNKLLNSKLLNKVIRDVCNTIMSLDSSETLDMTEFQRYLSAIQGGRFYECFNAFVNPGKQLTEVDRGKIKKTIFTIFFVDNRHGSRIRKLEAPFVKHFPTVYKVFSILKRHNKAILSHILQRLESELIIERITKRIANERPDLPIFTIHDSVATTEGNENYVKGVMEEEILKATGLEATIGKEYWKTVLQKDLKTQKPIANAA